MIHLKELTIDLFKEHLKKHKYIEFHNKGGELFQQDSNRPYEPGIIDIQTINALVKIYDALSPKNKLKFNSTIQDEYKFANLIDKMWSWFK